MDEEELESEDFIETFERLDFLLSIKDGESLVYEIDLLELSLSEEILDELETKFPELGGFIRKYLAKKALALKLN